MDTSGAELELLMTGLQWDRRSEIAGQGDGVGLRREEGVAWFCSGRGLVF